MAESQPFKPVTLYDSLSTVEGGMNSGIDPLLLEKNQLAMAFNLTTRQGFATNRPPFTNRLTINWPSPSVQEAFEQGLFQGAGYYQPDSGNQSIFASVAGRLFQFLIEGNVVTVTEQTVSGDPNPATPTQAWIWQSENYLIVNDGQSLPIFFDGTSSRRSAGPTVVLATASAGPATAPAIGETISVTLLAAYTGSYDVPVLFEGQYWQPTASSTGYEVSALQLYDSAASIPEGTAVYIKPSLVGVVASAPAVTGPYPSGTALGITFTEPISGPVGSKVTIYGKRWTLAVKLGNSNTFTADESGTFTPLPAGTQLSYTGSSAPNVLIGTTNTTVATPGNGGTVSLFLSAAFTGAAGTTVYIGTAGQYEITAVPPPPPGLSLDLVNLTATAGSAITYPEDILSVPELPAGRMGAYGLGQNWVSLTDGFSFICSDISRGPSGTQANSFRDSVLKTTDITFRGGTFAIPGAGNVITSMTFTANLDLSLGQGSLQVGTAQFMASCTAPIDFTNPPTNGPILTFSLIGTGPLAQDSTIRINSDVYFRSVAGLGSLIQARRDFDTPGNSPISEEMVRVLNVDDETLLIYGSSINFDNRFITTCSPQASSQGVIHAGLVVQNLDPVSGLRGKQPPVYDGLWTGLNVLKLVTGIFNGKQRAFAFTFNIALSKLELYEILPTPLVTSSAQFDNGDVPIVWGFETAALFNKDVKPQDQLISLRNGELAIDDIIGRVRIQVWYRPDQYGGQWQSACWQQWHDVTVCAASGSKPLYIPRIGLGEPDANACDATTNKPLRDGYTFQVKVQITGHCRVLRARFQAVTLPQPPFEPPYCNPIIEVEDS